MPWHLSNSIPSKAKILVAFGGIQNVSLSRLELLISGQQRGEQWEDNLYLKVSIFCFLPLVGYRILGRRGTMNHLVNLERAFDIKLHREV